MGASRRRQNIDPATYPKRLAEQAAVENNAARKKQIDEIRELQQENYTWSVKCMIGCQEMMRDAQAAVDRLEGIELAAADVASPGVPAIPSPTPSPTLVVAKTVLGALGLMVLSWSVMNRKPGMPAPEVPPGLDALLMRWLARQAETEEKAAAEKAAADAATAAGEKAAADALAAGAEVVLQPDGSVKVGSDMQEG